MSYKKYKIEIANPRGDRYTITINELFLLILCRIAEGHTVPKIKESLDRIKIVKEQVTIEGYIQEMKEMFQLKLPGREGNVCKDELGIAAKKFGLIAERNGRHVIIIEETIAETKQPKLFDI